MKRCKSCNRWWHMNHRRCCLAYSIKRGVQRHPRRRKMRHRNPRGGGGAAKIRKFGGGTKFKFGQLICKKIIKIVATRCHILRLKCTKFNFGKNCVFGLSVVEEIIALLCSFRYNTRVWRTDRRTDRYLCCINTSDGIACYSISLVKVGQYLMNLFAWFFCITL